MHRYALGVLGAIAWLVLLAPPAAAHTGATAATDYEATVTRPLDLAGATFRVVNSGARVELTNRSVRPVVVLGYENEPYLRIGAHGVYENTRSPATYLNANRSGGDASAPPRWRRVGDGPTWRWHDHRVHWMAGDPPDVQHDRSHRHVVARWELPVRGLGRVARVEGVIAYVPGPALWPWVAGAVVLAATAYLLRRTGLSVGALVAADVVRSIATGHVDPISLGGWALAAAAVVLRRRHPDQAIAAGLAGLTLAIVGGALPWLDLRHSQVAIGGAVGVVRAAATVCAGVGAGLAAGALRSAGE